MVGGRWQLQQKLQQNVDWRRLAQVCAAHDVGDVLGRVVDHDRQVIGCAHIPPRQDDVADVVRHVPIACAIECFSINGLQGFVHVEAECGIQWARAGAGLNAAGAGIDDPVGAHGRAFLRSAGGGEDIAAVAGAGIEQPAGPKRIEGGGVGGQSVRLAHHRGGPCEAKPGEVIVYLRFPFRAGAGLVNVFDPQQERAARRPCHVMRKKRGIGVAQMQRASGRRGEARDQAGTVSVWASQAVQSSFARSV